LLTLKIEVSQSVQDSANIINQSNTKFHFVYRSTIYYLKFDSLEVHERYMYTFFMKS